MLYYNKFHTGNIVCFYENEQDRSTHLVDDFDNLKIAKAAGRYHRDPNNEFELSWGWDEEEFSMKNYCIFRKDNIYLVLTEDFTYTNSDTNTKEGFKREISFEIFKGQSFRCLDDFCSLELQTFLNKVWDFAITNFINTSEDS